MSEESRRAKGEELLTEAYAKVNMTPIFEGGGFFARRDSAAMEVILQLVPVIDTPCLGSLNEKGEVYGTCGWQSGGLVWVMISQIEGLEKFGWKQTGKTSPFQDIMLHEMMK